MLAMTKWKNNAKSKLSEREKLTMGVEKCEVGGDPVGMPDNYVCPLSNISSANTDISATLTASRIVFWKLYLGIDVCILLSVERQKN